MVRTVDPQLDVEPTPEFNQKCLDAIRRWERGELPFKETIALLNSYNQEAVAANHIANQGRAEHLLGYLQHYRGNLNTSIQHYERARALYKRANNLKRAAAIDLNQGENYRFKGDFNRAIRLYRAAYAAAEQLGMVDLQTMAAVNEGLTLVTIGQNTSARHAFEEGLRLAELWTENREQLPGLLCETYHGIAVACLRQGEIDAACDSAYLALQMAQETGHPLHLGFANRAIAEVITELGEQLDPRFGSDPDEYFRTALEAFRDINAEAEMARTMYAHAQSLARRGRRTTAARKLQQVMIIFTRLDMVDDAARAAEAQLAVI